MTTRLIKASAGARAQIFHDADKGMRGINLLRSSGSRGNCLYITVLDPDGRRKALTSYTLDGVDFMTQWGRAVHKVAEYHNVASDDQLYADMLEAWREFLDRYSITLETSTKYLAHIPPPTTEAHA